jgi:hypothetical protein
MIWDFLFPPFPPILQRGIGLWGMETIRGYTKGKMVVNGYIQIYNCPPLLYCIDLSVLMGTNPRGLGAETITTHPAPPLCNKVLTRAPYYIHGTALQSNSSQILLLLWNSH